MVKLLIGLPILLGVMWITFSNLPAPAQVDEAVCGDSAGPALIEMAPTAAAEPAGAPLSGAPKPAAVGEPAAGQPAGYDAAVEAAVRDILQFRARQGSVLKGTILSEFGQGDNAQFAEILRGVVQAGRRPPAEASTPGSPVPAPTAPPASAAQLPKVDPGSETPEEPESLVIAMHDLARRLERKATVLELQRAYDDADRVRELASRIWRESRYWADPSGDRAVPAVGPRAQQHRRE